MTRTNTILIGAALIAVLTVFAYSPALNGGFIWDDDLHVSNNAHLRSVGGLVKIWFKIGSMPQYYPVTFTSFWIDYHLWGLNTTGYHVVNVLLHILNALLLWMILARLAVPGAWFIAIFFALHPVNVESVAWISERKNVLSSLLYLSAFFTYLKYAGLDRRPTSPKKRDNRLYVLSLVLFVCALMSKTVTASLPAAILLVMWWKRGGITRRDVLRLVPFFLVGVAFGLLTVYMEKHHVGAAGDRWGYTAVDRILIAGRAAWFYAFKIMAPFRLIFNYPRWTIQASAVWQYLFPLAAGGVIAALWFLRNRIGRGPLTGLLFFLGTLAPALGFFDVYPFQYSFVADHFQYLASIGMISLVTACGVYAFKTFGAPRQAVTAAAGLIIIVCLVLSWRQAHIYRNIEVLWNDTIAENPGSWMAHNNLGILLKLRGDLNEAIEHFEKALEIKPDHAFAHYNFGDALRKQGKLEEAKRHYLASIALLPDDASSYINLGLTLKMQGRYDEAKKQYEKAIEILPDYSPAYYNLGLLYMERGENDKAIVNFKKAVEINPRSPSAYNNLGSVYFKIGKTVEAADCFKKTLDIDPTHAGAHYNLGNIMSREGGIDAAVRHYRAALRIRPDFASAHYNLGLLLQRQGYPVEAKRHLDEAARLRR